MSFRVDYKAEEFISLGCYMCWLNLRSNSTITIGTSSDTLYIFLLWIIKILNYNGDDVYPPACPSLSIHSSDTVCEHSILIVIFLPPPLHFTNFTIYCHFVFILIHFHYTHLLIIIFKFKYINICLCLWVNKGETSHFEVKV